MKRSIVFVLAVCMGLSLVACNASSTTPAPTSSSSVTNPSQEPAVPEQPVATATPDDPSEEKVVVLSASLLEVLWGNQESFDAAEYAEYLDEWETITAADVQEDGSITITLTEENHRKLLDELRRQLLDVESVPQDGLEKVEANEDCTKIQLYVDKAQYETDYNALLVVQKQFEAVQWQAFSGSWNGVLETSVIDADTGALLETVALDNLENR